MYLDHNTYTIHAIHTIHTNTCNTYTYKPIHANTCLNALQSIQIPATSTHKYSVIWLHGLGADGHDFEGIVPELNLIDSSSIRFIFPHAPVQAIAVNRGMEMRAWYDILSMDELQREVDVAGIERSTLLVNQLIQKEIDRGIPSSNILLVGFSQGGVLALHAGLRYPEQLAGHCKFRQCKWR